MIDNSILFPQPVQAPVRPRQGNAQPTAGNSGGTQFAEVLDRKLTGQPVRLSQHAQLEGAVDSVAQKGGRESLIMMGDAALVVSVKNRTVVTAMDRQSMKGNVFTNIDSAVFF
jgi:hypothetical protein